MFDSLSSRFRSAFQNLRGRGRISESNISESLREVRMALLEADVNFQVAKDFIQGVKEKAIGKQVFRSIKPGELMVKIIHDELVDLLGSSHQDLQLGKAPSPIMMVGLHGSGKTTSSGKLARLLSQEGRRPLLVAADVHRPAAMDQLEALGGQLEIPVLALKGETDVLRIAEEAEREARSQDRDVLIYDTAGRLQVDEDLIRELVRLHQRIGSQEVLLVLDAATGQEAVSVATHFDQALGITGCILTKLDGDARGGAALSMRAVTGKPVKMVGTGERLEEFQRFHPDRMASRILGMGDVVTLVEKAAEVIKKEDAQKMEKSILRGDFTLVDFLDQMRQLKRLGSMESVLRMIPGGGDILNQSQFTGNEKTMARAEAMICSMTQEERLKPQILNASRRKRIAAGSGVQVSELNVMLSRFSQMRRMVKRIGKKNPRSMRRMLKKIPRKALYRS